MAAEEQAQPSLHERRCQQVVSTYREIEAQLNDTGHPVPPETIAKLCEIALRLVLVRP